MIEEEELETKWLTVIGCALPAELTVRSTKRTAACLTPNHCLITHKRALELTCRSQRQSCS